MILTEIATLARFDYWHCQMSIRPNQGFGHRRWRGVLLLLVFLPFLPEIVVLLAALFAHVAGCSVGEKAVCAIGPFAASDIIRVALEAASLIGVSFAFGLAAVWLALSYLAIVKGWLSLSSRIQLALAVSLIFAFVPYFGPLLSIAPSISAGCHPNEGGIPPTCMIYGDVGDAAHEVVRVVWMFFLGAPIAFVAFLIFVLVARFLKRRTALQIDNEVSS